MTIVPLRSGDEAEAGEGGDGSVAGKPAAQLLRQRVGISLQHGARQWVGCEERE